MMVIIASARIRLDPRFGITASRRHHVGLLVPWSVYVYGVGEGLAGVGEFGLAVISICTHRVFVVAARVLDRRAAGIRREARDHRCVTERDRRDRLLRRAAVGAVLAQEPLVRRVRRVEGVRDRVALRCLDVGGDRRCVASVQAKLTIGAPVPPHPALAPFVIVFALETSLAKYAAEMSEPRESLYFSSALPTTRRPVMSARESGAMMIARIAIAMMSSGRVKPSSPRARCAAASCAIVPASR